MATEKGGNAGGVGLGSAHQEVNLSLRAAQLFLDEMSGVGAMLIVAVAHGGIQIGAGQCRQDTRVTALGIVIDKAIHGSILHSIFYKKRDSETLSPFFVIVS
jgi:hypothetical protein